MTLLSVEGIRSGYGSLQVLSEVSLEVAEGEAVAILGPNGAGKSTLLRTISGLITPTAGAISFDGHDLLAMPAHRIPHAGLVQVPEARHIFPSLSVRENLLVGGTPLPTRAAREAALDDIWRIFPMLVTKRDAPAGTLSGGQQQMVAIGRALMSRPRLVMLDEPSLGLAPLVVRELYEVLRSLVQSGLTLLLVEQDVPVALSLVSRAYVVENGSIALSGTASELRESDHVRQAYLGI